MSTKKTEHYALHAWEPTDDFLRSEFNDNFSTIDARLAQALGQFRVVVGTYEGNDGSQTISLPWRPKAIYITAKPDDYYFHHALLVNDENSDYGQIVDEGVTVRSHLNISPTKSSPTGSKLNPYRYIALWWPDEAAEA